jgi:exopolyphosphatase/guanosine-5'-triphosphate,3'-diphosphate pyrophosphatase
VRRAAVIDMGSNSFRLVVYGYEPGRFWQHVDEIREPVRVGQGMGEEATLKPEPMERAVSTAKVFGAFCRASGIDEVTAVATSAIRSAKNGEDLLDRIRSESGLDPRVIDEREEARYGYLAIANSTTIGDGFGIDIGGGSVQAMRIEKRALTESGSWQLGAVRVSEAFLPGDGEVGPKQLKALRKHVKSELESAEWFAKGENPPRAVGIGGTIRNLASAAERRAGLPDTDAQGYLLTRDALEELIEELAGMPPQKRGGVPGIKPDRGDVILGGAVVLGALMDRCGAEELEATDAGLREGVFFERFLEGDDPPLFPDVRGASVMNLAHRYQEDLHHPRHVARLSLEILDGLAAAGAIEPSAEDRELLWAAGMLHDIGTAVDYDDDHHKHSRYLILNARLPGFTPRELYLIALTARYHRKGDPDASELGKLARKNDDRRLLLLAGTIRLAEQLERSRDQSVRAVTVSALDGEVLLDPEAPADASVAIWSARRNADVLEKALDRTVTVAPGR